MHPPGQKAELEVVEELRILWDRETIFEVCMKPPRNLPCVLVKLAFVLPNLRAYTDVCQQLVHLDNLFGVRQ
jgi:hypothetical protein